jgi:hypothetical protein
VIFDIVVPVSNGVKTVRQNMEQMQRQQEAARAADESRKTYSQAQNASQASKKEEPIEAEYIDFEEVKKK